jgi:hypothetical protein
MREDIRGDLRSSSIIGAVSARRAGGEIHVADWPKLIECALYVQGTWLKQELVNGAKEHAARFRKPLQRGRFRSGFSEGLFHQDVPPGLQYLAHQSAVRRERGTDMYHVRTVTGQQRSEILEQPCLRVLCPQVPRTAGVGVDDRRNGYADPGKCVRVPPAHQACTYDRRA